MGSAVEFVRGLVLAEADVAVGPEHAAGSEVVGQLDEELFHRLLDKLLVNRLVLLPIRLRVVGRESLVKLDGLDGPPLERHEEPPVLRSLCIASNPSSRHPGFPIASLVT